MPTNVPMEEDMFVVSIGTASLVAIFIADNVSVHVMNPRREKLPMMRFPMTGTRQVECNPFGKPKLQVHDLLAR